MRGNKMIETKPVPEWVSQAGKKTTIILFMAQSLISAGLIAMFTVLAIIGEDLSGNPTWAGLPSATVQLAGAPLAFVWGVVWDRLGRRNGLSAGLMTGVLGVLLGVIAIQAHSMVLFLAGMVGIGGVQAAIRLARFIAAEVNPPLSRGRAISTVVLGGTVGAVVGPVLVAPSGHWALSTGLPELAGPFAVSVVLLGASVILTWIGLRPEPLTVSREVAILFPEKENLSGMARSLGELARLPGVMVAVVAMVLSQMVMVMVMGITSLYMRDHNHALGSISLVFGAHTLGMYALSMVSGKLVDQWGRAPVILSGAVMMVAAVALAPVSTAVPPLALALFLLGLGWNFCFVAGSALLADHLTPKERSRTQGTNDLLIGLVSAVGSLSSGVVFASMGYLMVNLAGGVFVLAMLGLTGWWVWSGKQILVAGD
jgi:MFS family permease